MRSKDRRELLAAAERESERHFQTLRLSSYGLVGVIAAVLAGMAMLDIAAAWLVVAGFGLLGLIGVGLMTDIGRQLDGRARRTEALVQQMHDSLGEIRLSMATEEGVSRAMLSLGGTKNGARHTAHPPAH